jgi:hypothetical protein
VACTTTVATIEPCCKSASAHIFNIKHRVPVKNGLTDLKRWNRLTVLTGMKCRQGGVYEDKLGGRLFISAAGSVMRGKASLLPESSHLREIIA